uniref:Uncharacterized protein n=1 Tax=Rhizophagus irregularis (strain DAOM 181602 / DAOM 197198 / MUCL 43194) TaxID=747089 RepID=U9UVE9_RHIID
MIASKERAIYIRKVIQAFQSAKGQQKKHISTFFINFPSDNTSGRIYSLYLAS